MFLGSKVRPVRGADNLTAINPQFSTCTPRAVAKKRFGKAHDSFNCFSEAL
jgi:hypothetical protein